MGVREFEAGPSKFRHLAYTKSMLSMTAPEYSTGEVLLASAYRRLLLGIGESEVDLDNIGRARDEMPEVRGGPDLWSRLLTERGGIESPLRQGQTGPRTSYQLMPIVPATARIAGVLGKRLRSRWNPSNLLFEVIGAGLGPIEGTALARRFGEALSLKPDDDVFARFVDDSLAQALTGVGPRPKPVAPFTELEIQAGDILGFRSKSPTGPRCPAERLCCDLPSVLEAKGTLSRRQWTVLVEALLRIGLGMHALWTCHANSAFWELTLSTASGEPPATAGTVERIVWGDVGRTPTLLELGADAEPLIKRLVEKYAYARTGLNLLLCRLDDVGAAWPANEVVGYVAKDATAPMNMSKFLAHVATNRQKIDGNDAGQWLRSELSHYFDRPDLRTLASCTSGYTKNLLEFARHSLGQIKAKRPEQRCYDVAYLLSFSGDRKPLPVEPGPAMLLMLVHACCSAHSPLPVSLDDFRQHLAEYGLHVPAGELVNGKTGRGLGTLGLVVDSPDAAGGRLLVPPL